VAKLKLALVIAAPLVAGAATYAVAQGNGPGAQDAPGRAKMIEKFDKNGDGKLDDAERAERKAAFEAKRAARTQEALARYDLDKNGQLDKSERAAMRDDQLTARFQKMDKNGDGKLTLDEFKSGAKRGEHRHGRHGHGRGRMRGGTGGTVR
jgi:Ca2+-binding EF-hand superfamily protein